MLIAAGLAILAIFMGGPQNDLLILKMDKHIKEYVVEKDRQQEIMTEEEWGQVIAASEKTFKKEQKSSDKTLSKGKKALAKMEQQLVGSFKDAEKKKQAELRASEFSATLYTSTEEILNYNQFDEETLIDYNAVESELLAVLENYSQEWNSMLQALVKVHVELAQIATPDEWKSVSKALKKII